MRRGGCLFHPSIEHIVGSIDEARTVFREPIADRGKNTKPDGIK
jgi:hypothetical protein